MAWNLEGTYFETCSCEVVCPCSASLALGADYDRCQVTLVFTIAKGEVEGTDIGGLTIAAIVDTPKVMSEGNWRLGVFVDEKASDEQAEKLVGVFSGQLGGPMQALAPLVAEKPLMNEPRSKSARGPSSQRQDRDFIDFEIEDVVPFWIESANLSLERIFHPVGLSSSSPRPRARVSTPSVSSTRVSPAFGVAVRMAA
jgi:hypothetical protein